MSNLENAAEDQDEAPIPLPFTNLPESDEGKPISDEQRLHLRTRLIDVRAQLDALERIELAEVTADNYLAIVNRLDRIGYHAAGIGAALLEE